MKPIIFGVYSVFLEDTNQVSFGAPRVMRRRTAVSTGEADFVSMLQQGQAQYGTGIAKLPIKNASPSRTCLKS